ncbi:putative F-box domain-containing protein [Medicago truncatula]|uniref:F-box and associated interaction domain protein n=1 Tax=Medicago truncatula TaxID=3880 RepID=A0A072UYM2_MEDTR|nr:F-box and associated interaction domain protein [Medicago truncatula]RHN67597.1 putative F-box domain-containing protein [Medicago truncatula]
MCVYTWTGFGQCHLYFLIVSEHTLEIKPLHFNPPTQHCLLSLPPNFITELCVAMERKRSLIPSPRDTKRGKTGKEKVDVVETQELSPSFADLPFPIATDVLLRLPIKSVLVCKCVCRTWNTVISDPHFAKVHFERSPYGFLILTCDRRLVPRTNLTVNATAVI